MCPLKVSYLLFDRICGSCNHPSLPDRRQEANNRSTAETPAEEDVHGHAEPRCEESCGQQRILRHNQR